MGFVCKVCKKGKMETVQSTIRHIFYAYGLMLDYESEEDKKLLGRFIYEEIF